MTRRNTRPDPPPRRRQAITPEAPAAPAPGRGCLRGRPPVACSALGPHGRARAGAPWETHSQGVAQGTGRTRLVREAYRAWRIPSHRRSTSAAHASGLPRRPWRASTGPGTPTGVRGGGGAAGEASERRKMATGRMPMQDLQQKQLDRDHRGEEAVTSRRGACGLPGSTDRVGVQWGGPIRFDTVQDSRDTGDHGGSPLRKRGELTLLPEDRRAFQSSSRLCRKRCEAKLNAIRVRPSSPPNGTSLDRQRKFVARRPAAMRHDAVGYAPAAGAQNR